MKNKLTLTLVALGLTLPVANLEAQDDSRPQRGPRGERPIPAFIAALDANKDKVLDKSEIEAAPTALKKLDADNDGKITMRELRGGPVRGGDKSDGDRPERPARSSESSENAEPRRPQGPQGPIAALDANKSGAIDADELAGAPAALLKLDKNSDGQLTVEEFQMARGARGDRPEGGRPREGRGPRGGDAEKSTKE